MTGWMCQEMMPQEMGLLPRSWWAKQGSVPSSCPCTKRQTQCSRHHPRKKKPGWQGSLRQPAPPSCSPTMDSPRDCRTREERHPAGCARKGLASGKESATSLAPPRPHLGSAGGSAGPAPGSSESGPPSLRTAGAASWAGRSRSSAAGSCSLGGVVRVGPTQEGRVTVAQGQALEFRLALQSPFVFFFPPSPRGSNRAK